MCQRLSHKCATLITGLRLPYLAFRSMREISLIADAAWTKLKILGRLIDGSVYILNINFLYVRSPEGHILL